MWLSSQNIKCIHGFSTREGGVSHAPFDSLNLGGSEDHPENIIENRRRSLSLLRLSIDKLCFLKQVHGTKVCEAKPGQQEGDALVSNKKDQVLAVSIADCYPILFHDPVNSIIGAAHAGWRGTVGRIAANTVQSMLKIGASVQNIQVAIGQGICTTNFEVGKEVTDQFASAGFPPECRVGNKIDLVKSNRFVLEECGIPPINIWAMNRCSFEKEFFSYRRDKGITGRMWGVISLG